MKKIANLRTRQLPGIFESFGNFRIAFDERERIVFFLNVILPKLSFNFYERIVTPLLLFIMKMSETSCKILSHSCIKIS